MSISIDLHFKIDQLIDLIISIDHRSSIILFLLNRLNDQSIDRFSKKDQYNNQYFLVIDS